MVDRNIIVFSDPAIDTGFIVKLAGFPWQPAFDPFCGVFKPVYYDVVIDDQRHWLIHTAGLPSSRTGRSSLQAPEVLENLYSFIRRFSEVRLLIYVVRTDKPTSKNFRFFYDYLCQQDAPIILVQTTHTPSDLTWFDLVLTLDGADPESDGVNLRKAITKHLNRNPMFISYTDRFEWAARGCWKLLAKEASWSLADFRDALKFKHKGNLWLTDVDARCERIVKHVQMGLKKKSAIEQVSVRDDIQQSVDAILSTILAAGNVTPIPFLSVATENIENIVETIQVCEITIDLRSYLIAYKQTFENNQEALESLVNDAKRLVVLLWGTYCQSHDQKNWPPEELRDVLEALLRYVSGFPLDIASKYQRGWIWISILQDICRFVDDNLLRDLSSGFGIQYSKTDSPELQIYKKALDTSLKRFKVSIFLEAFID